MQEKTFIDPYSILGRLVTQIPVLAEALAEVKLPITKIDAQSITSIYLELFNRLDKTVTMSISSEIPNTIDFYAYGYESPVDTLEIQVDLINDGEITLRYDAINRINQYLNFFKKQYQKS